MHHAGAGIGVSAGRNFVEKGAAGTHYRSLAYAVLGRELWSSNQYYEEHMQVTAQSTRKCAVELERRVSDSQSQEYSFWLFQL